MSASQMNNVRHLLIGGTANLSTGLFGSLNAGEIGIFDAAGNRIVESGASTNEVNATAGMDFFFALAANPKRTTPLIKGSKLKSISAKAYAADTQQEDIIGYNGTSGSIEAINNNLYMVQMYIEEFLTSSQDGRLIKHFQYKSDSTATQAEVAIGLAGSAYNNFQREPEKYVKFKAICNTAASATNDFLGASTIIKGSKSFTIAESSGSAADAGQYATSTELAVGDFIRIAADASVTDLATNNATTRAYAVYKVTAISNISTALCTVTVDRPIDHMTSTSTSLADSDDAMQVIPAATGAAADWGVVATGQARTINSTGKIFNKLATWTTNLKDFGTSTFASTGSAKGTGTLAELRDVEWFLQGNRGETYRMGEPAIHSYTSLVDANVTGSGYDYLDIVYEDDTVVGFTSNISPIHVTLATPATAPDYMTNGTDGIRDVLEIIGSSVISAGDIDV